MSVCILTGDCRELLPTLPDESVHCVVTSPPYWGLRDYGTGSWVGGLEGCSHTRDNPREDHSHGEWSGTRGNQPAATNGATPYKQTCKCGAVRVDQQIGLERTLDEYIATMVVVFREVRRILRKDGTLWLNMGDSYNTGTSTPSKENKNVDHGQWANSTHLGRRRADRIVKESPLFADVVTA